MVSWFMKFVRHSSVNWFSKVSAYIPFWYIFHQVSFFFSVVSDLPQEPILCNKNCYQNNLLHLKNKHKSLKGTYILSLSAIKYGAIAKRALLISIASLLVFLYAAVYPMTPRSEDKAHSPTVVFTKKKCYLSFYVFKIFFNKCT